MAISHAFGTTLSWNSNTVGKLTNIGGVEISVDMVEATTHASADSFKEYIAGLLDAGEISVEGYLDPADTNGQVAMATDMYARTSRTGVITFPAATGTTWTFTGFVSKFKVGDAGLDGAIPFSASIKTTGKPTFAVAISTGMSACTMTTATIYPTFAIGTFSYVATTTGATFTVTPTAATHTITITANGASQTVTSGGTSSAISAGSINTVTPVVIVVQETNKAPKTYTFQVTKTA